MPRHARIAPGGWIFHVLNRANGGGELFETASCYREFLGIVEHAARVDGMRILAYCAMPNHWHMLLWPCADGDLARFIHRVSTRHAQRWHLRHQTTGRGHLYQSRYKSFVVRTDEHLLTVCRYIERNPLRARLAGRAEAWPWSSAATRLRDGGATRSAVPNDPKSGAITLTPLPVELPSNWASWLHDPQSEREVEALRSCLSRGLPYGDPGWQAEVTARLGLRLESRGPGRARRSG